jgi:thymidylate synthase (FAD)
MVSEPRDRTAILDHGYVQLVETWGSDERVVEAARMSTDKGFTGWGGVDPCPECMAAGAFASDGLYMTAAWQFVRNGCKVCAGSGKKPGDEKLLAYLWAHRHTTPFEMGGMVVEVQAPIFVFREWHRHRTQSYNELSARYTPLPDTNYVPTAERLLVRVQGNRQAQGTGAALTPEGAEIFRTLLQAEYANQQALYAQALASGVPKELARCVLPVARYSRMRASANLWNWLHFLTLRMDEHAQWEIRQYANAVGALIAQAFPRTWQLYGAPR